MESNRDLVAHLKRCGYIRTSKVEDSFLKIDRRLFVDAPSAGSAYEDCPLPIISGGTISAPSIVALMSEALLVRDGDRILEVGAGSGYQAAILSFLVGKRGKVFTTEIVPQLWDYSRERLKKFRNVSVACTDGSVGLGEKAPFDKIIVTAACPELPRPLVGQLKDGGIIIAPVEGFFCHDLIRATKKGGKVFCENICPVIFVPLIGRHGYSEKRIC